MQTVESLEALIAGANRVLRGNPNDHKTIHTKGTIFAQLGDITDDSSYYDKALKCYEEAIKLSKSEIPLYFVNRAILNTEMGNTISALKDMKIINTFPKNKKGDGVDSIYIKQSMDNIAETETMKSKVAILKDKGEITDDLASILDSQLESTNRLWVNIGVHGKKLHEHDNKFVAVGHKFKELEKELKEQKEFSAKMFQAFTEQQANHAALRGEIGDEMKNNYIALRKRFDDLSQTIEDSKIAEVAKVRKAFEELASDDVHPELNIYCKTFYWTMLNLFDAYRVVSSSIVKGNIHSDISTTEKILEEALVKGVGYGATFAQSIPIAGGLVAMVDNIISDIYKTVKGRELTQKANIISAILKDSFLLEQDISLGVAKAALALTEVRDKDIRTPKDPSTNKLKTGFNWLQNLLVNTKEKIFPYETFNDKKNWAVSLAAEDVTLTIASFLINYEEIVQSKNSLDKEIKLIIQCDKLKEHLDGLSISEMKTTTTSSTNAANTTSNVNGSENIKVAEVQSSQKVEQPKSASSSASQPQLAKKTVQLASFAEIEKAMKDDLEVIHRKAKDGNWDKLGVHISPYKSLQSSYLVDKIFKGKKDKKLITAEDAENTKIVIFKNICIGITKNKSEDDKKKFKCLEEFNKVNKELTEKIAAEYPKFFINDSIVKACKFEAAFEKQLINALNDPEHQDISSDMLGQGISLTHDTI